MRSIWPDGLDPETRLWRYMTGERLLETLNTAEVHFAAATQFEDRFEGAVAVIPRSIPTDPRYAEPDFAERAFRELKRLTKLNCWHCESFESHAMWRLYADEGKGIALCTTVGRIGEAFEAFRLRPDYGIEDLWGGHVRYQDLTEVRLRPGMLERFFYKHRAFAWEREFRLAISLRQAEEFAVPVPDLGIRVGVDLGLLVEAIVLGPAHDTDQREQLLARLEELGMQARLLESSLLGRPRYI